MTNTNVVNLISTDGYNDGYYWDERYIFEMNGKKFVHINVGSGSGYIPCHGYIAYYNGEELLAGERFSEFMEDLNEDTLPYILRDLAVYANKLIESGETELELWNDDQYYD